MAKIYNLNKEFIKNTIVNVGLKNILDLLHLMGMNTSSLDTDKNEIILYRDDKPISVFITKKQEDDQYDVDVINTLSNVVIYRCELPTTEFELLTLVEDLYYLQSIKFDSSRGCLIRQLSR